MRPRLGHVHLPDLFHQPLPGGGLLLFAHDAGLFVVLALLHFRKNAGLFYLLLKATQRNIEVIVVFVKKNSGQENHPLRRGADSYGPKKYRSRALPVHGLATMSQVKCFYSPEAAKRQAFFALAILYGEKTAHADDACVKCPCGPVACPRCLQQGCAGFCCPCVPGCQRGRCVARRGGRGTGWQTAS